MIARVLVIGAGLVGSSVGMALTQAGVRVTLEDRATSHALVAASLGAGRVGPAGPDEIDVVVVATPPDSIAAVVRTSLERFPNAVVTDVGSVKAPIAEALNDIDARRYVGSHPMAGSQYSGPLTASAALFEGRTWVVSARPDNRPEDVAIIEELAAMTGAVLVHLDPITNVEAVAQLSHVHHLMSILTARHLRGVPA
ncbi:MAG: prephenate dehydrogenase, partial [Arachnia sp.]